MRQVLAEPRRTILLAVLAGAVCAAISVPTSDFGFVNWDDDRSVRKSPAREMTHAECLGWSFSEPRFQSYHPLHLELLCLQFASWDGRSAEIFHRTSVLLMAIFGIVFFMWLRREGFSALASFLTLGVFAAHPLMVETYASIVSQKDLLGLIFGLGALSVRGRQYTVRSREIAAQALVSLLVVAAALSKSGYAMFGLVILFREWITHDWRTALRRGAAPAVVGVVLLAVALRVVVRAELPDSDAVWFDPLLILRTFGFYLLEVVWPAEPVAIRCLEGTLLQTVAGLVAIGLGAMCLFATKLPAWLRFSGGIAFIGVLPYSNVVPAPDIVSGRWGLMPLLGVSAGLAPLFERALARVVGGVLVLGLAWMSVGAQPIWKDALSLWRATTQVSRCNSTAFINLSVAEFVGGHVEEAEEALVSAILVEPAREKTYRDLALLFLLEGDCGPPRLPLEAQKLFAASKDDHGAARLMLEEGWAGAALVLALREKDAFGEPKVFEELGGQALTRLRQCNPSRARRIERLVDGR